ncbi:hypothetical protein [Massilia sp. Se16.2.3]|uniref:hypothetical protein n=1 Tax=Massilia sp. Se16.2.3 TaxID=2709303 RepID=UPI0015FEE5E3|nr:hypothetical protein [Massilia sp. Se16.2.3]QNA98635.1 hypothetical protein G4G31_07005 [Massilia sp. Se16.2.3]
MDTRHPPDHLPDPLGDTAELDLRLAGLREALSAVDTPRCVDKELMQAFQAQFSRRPRYRRLGALEWIATALAGGLGAAMLALLLVPPRLAGDGYPQAPLLRLDDGGAFVALDSLERIEREPAPRLVAADLPRTVLATLGLPIDPEYAGDSIRAEMLVDAAGEPLALRLGAFE